MSPKGSEDSAKLFADSAESMYDTAKSLSVPSRPGVPPAWTAGARRVVNRFCLALEASGDRSAAMAAEATVQIFERGESD